MAEKKKTEKKSTSTTKSSSSSKSAKRSWSSIKIMDCVGYFSIIFIAIALILKLAFKSNVPTVAQAFESIGECLAYIICIWLGFYWAMRKCHGNWNGRNVWWLICWIVATVVIIVLYIFTF